ncbi:hypothetical protein [uncultured Winogradskyella sp.]|uniref:hypothetical protein n=1 Tax=uncultured Winogradskyella sp. TaxID=395353 RepID=UPI00261AB2BE|nr:hypothetical protein [uncultured Winogradskyella sp.]
MNKLLIVKAFVEARLANEKKGIKKPSQTDISKELSNFIDKEEGFSLDERSYRNYYNEAKNLLDTQEDISIKQMSIINGLCKYLGFNNYQEFTESLVEEEEKSIFKKIKILIKKNKIVISIMSIIIIGLIMYNSITRQRWMVWQEDHYVEVKFDLEKYNVNQLKVYKEERIEFFKKINPTCAYEFFNEDGSVKVWYEKNKNGELEYFTDLGLHPETGETLKKITQYMIDKYICKEQH